MGYEIIKPVNVYDVCTNEIDHASQIEHHTQVLMMQIFKDKTHCLMH